MKQYCKDSSSEKEVPDESLNITKYDLCGLIHHRGVYGSMK